MRIQAISQSYSTELRKIESAKKVDKESKTGKLANADRSDFSSGATRLSETKAETQAIQASLSAQPEIRMDRIADVKEKIESGYYNSDEFLNKLTDRMLNEFGFIEPKNSK
jgi:flagellar biosynthesis anti-sigma factor FlgM